MSLPPSVVCGIRCLRFLPFARGGSTPCTGTTSWCPVLASALRPNLSRERSTRTPFDEDSAVVELGEGQRLGAARAQSAAPGGGGRPADDDQRSSGSRSHARRPA